MRNRKPESFQRKRLTTAVMIAASTVLAAAQASAQDDVL